MKYDKPGRPITHGPIYCVETNQIYESYKEAAKAIGGDKTGVFRVVNGMQKSHHGFHFKIIGCAKKNMGVIEEKGNY